MSAPANPQSVQKLLDENAQLIRALVENLNIKGKPMECLQYQQSLHKNLVFLASLADPNLNVQTILPAPGTTPSTTTAVSGGVVPQSVAAAVAAAGGGVSSHLTTSTVTNQRQPQAVSASSGSVATPSDAMRQAPPGGQYPPGAGKGYGGGSMWSGQGQGDPYAMQRSAMSSMAGTGYPGMSTEAHLRMRQEQLIQAQQARRMQQQAAAAAGGGGMYPPPGMMPPQPGMPPGYPPTTMNPHSMPPGGNRPMKMH